MEQKPLIKSLRVSDERNSFTYGTSLSNLDWDNWSIDTGEYGEYVRLLVRHKELGTSVQVACKVTDHPRLAFKDGALYWIVMRTAEIDLPNPKVTHPAPPGRLRGAVAVRSTHEEW